MKFVNEIPNPSGAYQGPHKAPFPGCLPLTDSQAETLVAYNGFVTITREPDPEIEGSSVTVTPDLEAWEAWTAAQPPEPEPEPGNVPDWDGLEEGHTFAVGDHFTHDGTEYEVLRAFNKQENWAPPALLNDYYKEVSA